MNLDVAAGMRFARVIAQDSGMTLVMKEDCKVPHTNGRKIVLPMLRPEWDVNSKESKMWWFSLLHECYHNKEYNREDFALIDKYGVKEDSALAMVLNVVVDHNIERKEYGIYQGADEWMDISYQDAYQRIADRFDFYPETEKAASGLKALVAFDMTMRSQWSGLVNLHLEEELGEDARKQFDSLMSQLGEDYPQPRDGGEPNMDMTKRVMKALDLEEEMESSMEFPDGDGEGQSSEDKGEESGEGSGKGEDGEADDGDAAGGKLTDGEGEDTKKVITQFYDDAGQESHEKRTAESGPQTHLEYDWDSCSTGGYETVKEVEYPPHSFPPNSSVKDGAQSGLSFALSDKVKNILKVMSQVKYRGGYKRGKLHKKAIARVANGGDRIFRQKEQQVTLDTAVTVLLDSSGSMHGKKYKHGMQACCMLNDALNNVNVPVEILGFSQQFSGDNHNQHYIHSPFSKRTSTDELLDTMSGVPLENNDDGASIMWAYSRLIRHKAKRKILIVLSDGSPACKQAHAMPFTKEVIKEIEEKSPVEIYGIGILDSNVERLYSEHQVIKDIDQLEAALLSVVKSKIIN